MCFSAEVMMSLSGLLLVYLSSEPVDSFCCFSPLSNSSTDEHQIIKLKRLCLAEHSLLLTANR